MQLDPRVQQAHDDALTRGDAGYFDPLSGLFVMTSRTLADRGKCCGSGCRHCPYSPEEQLRAGRPGGR